MADRLTHRQLNRASLARQLLLERASLPIPDAVRQLVGLQAQAANAPYVGLWTRLASFSHDALASLLISRAVVRAPLMRATIHLVTADDFIELYSLVRPVIERGFAATFGRRLADVDAAAVLAAGRALVEERPRTRQELSVALAERWPEADATALAEAITHLLPTV